MTNGRTASRQQTGSRQSGKDGGDIGEAVGLLIKHLIGGAPGALGGQLPGIMDELRAALSPLQALRPDYGDLPKAQAELLRQVQAANGRADLSRASPTGQPRPNAEDNVVQKGART